LRLTKEINDKVKQFQTTYKRKDKQDLLAMSLLTFAVDLHKARTKTTTNLSTNHLSERQTVTYDLNWLKLFLSFAYQ